MTDNPAPPIPPLPPRNAHAVWVHFAVDAAAAFLAIIVVGLILDASIAMIIVVSIVAGAALAPYTHRIEERQLAERRLAQSAPDHNDPPGVDDRP